MYINKQSFKNHGRVRVVFYLRLSLEKPIVTPRLMNCTIFHHCSYLWTKGCLHYVIFIKQLLGLCLCLCVQCVHECGKRFPECKFCVWSWLRLRGLEAKPSFSDVLQFSLLLQLSWVHVKGRSWEWVSVVCEATLHYYILLF